MKIKEWCKNHPNRITFIVLCIFSSIIYMQFILGHYATDTYTISEVGYDTYIKSWYLTDGRIFSALFLFIIKIFNISIEWANTISILIAIVLSKKETLFKVLLFIYYLSCELLSIFLSL